ncbi:MAG: Origin recognition complex, subunit 1 [Thelocarpon impressellum]|nr:MAG: Origin recognition complex, subunit 1 [Thelocarpon impressellum]
MSRTSASQERNVRRSKAERARRFLAGGGVSREDSDDELGLDDHPWEWVYGSKEAEGEEATDFDTGSDDGESAAGALNNGVSASRKRRAATAVSGGKRPIVGARMGHFRCVVGDCVLLKAEGTNEAWVGLICEFTEGVCDDGEHVKAASFMWFSTDKEIRNKQKKRTDAMQNELYITPSWDSNPLASINGKASVVSAATFLAKHPSGKVPRSSKDYGKIFVCRRGCNTRTATYTEEFDWEKIYTGTDEDIQSLIERVQSETKATRKKRGEGKAREDTYIERDEDEVPETPRKKRRLTSASTPKSHHGVRTPQKLTTPTQKRVIIKKPLEFTPLGTRVLSPGHVISSPYQIARSRLHVAAVPATLPCREQEFSTVYSHLEAAISDGSGTCIYISGTPGTGKTATVREVVSQLSASVVAEELDDFIFVEINGMKVTDPHQSYSLLWEALRGERVSPAHALDLLEREFGNPSPRRVPCVVLMDELDQLVTKNQSVMYNFFNWPGLRHSRLIVLAVANTMDLPERTLSNKISSRLGAAGLTRITFPGYTHEQLMKIIESRLADVPSAPVDPDAIQFASRKVAAVSGDARRALDICRRAVELAEEASAASPPPTPSKRPLPSATSSSSRVTISTIKAAIQEATSSPLHLHLRCLPLATKLFLAALLARARREGLQESVLGDVLDEAGRMARMADTPALRGLLASSAVPGEGTGPRVYGLGGAAWELMEAGVVGLEARRGERTGKVRLQVGEEEVRLALRDDGEVRGLGFAA